MCKSVRSRTKNSNKSGAARNQPRKRCKRLSNAAMSTWSASRRPTSLDRPESVLSCTSDREARPISVTLVALAAAGATGDRDWRVFLLAGGAGGAAIIQGSGCFWHFYKVGRLGEFPAPVRRRKLPGIL